ncbi:hypothetical protein D3C85_1776130 [compost metagenome]
MGQGDQLRLQLQTVTAEGKTLVAMAEQRTLQLRFKLRQLFTQQCRLDVEATGRLHEAAAPGNDPERLRELWIEPCRQRTPGCSFC